MKPGLLQRAIWTYVAACAAWEVYPKPTTVLTNESIIAFLGGCMIEEASGFCDLHESYACRLSADKKSTDA